MKQETKWDKEYDVVVAGGGGSGIAAAITAYDNGASVIILEKGTSPRRGQTRTSGVGAAFATNPEGRGRTSLRCQLKWIGGCRCIIQDFSSAEGRLSDLHERASQKSSMAGINGSGAYDQEDQLGRILEISGKRIVRSRL